MEGEANQSMVQKHQQKLHDQKFAKGAKVRQARRTVARFEQHIALGWRFTAQAFFEFFRLFKRPGTGGVSEGI